MRKYYYLLSLLFVFTIPSLFLGYLLSEQISFADLLYFIAGITILGSIWDIWATRHGKRDQMWLWQFSHNDTLGVTFFDLPIEEYLFYVATSTYVIFIWEGIKIWDTQAPLEIMLALPFVAVWSLFAMIVPYIIRSKNDRIV